MFVLLFLSLGFIFGWYYCQKTIGSHQTKTSDVIFSNYRAYISATNNGTTISGCLSTHITSLNLMIRCLTRDGRIENIPLLRFDQGYIGIPSPDELSNHNSLDVLYIFTSTQVGIPNIYIWRLVIEDEIIFKWSTYPDPAKGELISSLYTTSALLDYAETNIRNFTTAAFNRTDPEEQE